MVKYISYGNDNSGRILPLFLSDNKMEAGNRWKKKKVNRFLGK
jgi:hypothetical protein